MHSAYLHWSRWVIDKKDTIDKIHGPVSSMASVANMVVTGGVEVVQGFRLHRTVLWLLLYKHLDTGECGR